MTDTTRNHIGGGVFFDLVVQGRNVTLTLPDRPDPALAGVPPGCAAFAGRLGQLDQILGALSPATPAAVVAVTGLAGMGKTELLLQAAHRALWEEGWFPGGVLFLDLHGYDPERRVSPKQALGTLLRALGIPPKHIPPGIEERARIYRSALGALAAGGRRVLVVLDDVPATDTVRHLLPGDRGTATLVSARHSLAELDALALSLRQLPADEGRQLLGDALRHALPEDPRMADEPEEAERLVTLCGGLPLALRILASLLVDMPSRPFSHLRRDLEATLPRLSVLSREARAVAPAFDLSYRGLTEAQARLFRMTCLHPGPDFSTEATARLYGGSGKETERLLEDLARRHLLEPGETYGRWRLHSLVRHYSWERLAADNDSREQCRARLLAYLHEMTTLACQRLFDPAAEQTAVEPLFSDRAEALRWLEVERRTLIAAAVSAHETGDDPTCVALAVALARFLAHMRYLEDAEQVLIAGIRSSRRGQDAFHQAALLSSLGVVLAGRRKMGKSIRKHRRAVKICRKLKDRRALAGALNNLGLSLHERRRFDEAIAAHVEATRLFKRVGDRLGVARALSNIGEIVIELGRTAEAERALHKAAKIFRKQGDLRGYAQALGSLARATRDDGKAELALKLHQRVLDMSDGLLLPHDRAVELSNYACTLVASGDFEAALTAQQEALHIFRGLGERHAEAMVVGNMALVRQRQGKWNKAVRLHTLALEAFLESNDDHRLAAELTSLAVALLNQGCNTEALENLELAADLFHRTGDTERTAGAIALVDQVRRRHGAIARPA